MRELSPKQLTRGLSSINRQSPRVFHSNSKLFVESQSTLELRERIRERVARLFSPFSPWAEKKNGASEPSNLTKVMR